MGRDVEEKREAFREVTCCGYHTEVRQKGDSVYRRTQNLNTIDKVLRLGQYAWLLRVNQ